MAEIAVRKREAHAGWTVRSMVDRKRRRPRKAGGRRREPSGFQRVRVDAPPAMTTLELAFPWTSTLAIGSDPVPHASRSRHDAPAPQRRKPVAE